MEWERGGRGSVEGVSERREGTLRTHEEKGAGDEQEPNVVGSSSSEGAFF